MPMGQSGHYILWKLEAKAKAKAEAE